MACDPWPIVIDPECCPDWATLPVAARDRGIRIATEIIWALSGRQFQICTACVRPCKTYCMSCGDSFKRAGEWGVFYRFGNQATSAGCGCECGNIGGCGCKSTCAVRLDPAPVIAILEVRIGGAVIPSGEYQVIDGHILVRDPAKGCWPKCNDLGSPNSVSGTWSVTYSYGTKASAVALDMAAILACEIAKHCMNLKCRLTGRITQLSRDGVSITLDPKAFIDEGLTSLPEIDQWLRAVNPYGLAQRGEVWSPDFQPLRQVTWPAATC